MSARWTTHDNSEMGATRPLKEIVRQIITQKGELDQTPIINET